MENRWVVTPIMNSRIIRGRQYSSCIGDYLYVETLGNVGRRLKIEMNNPSYSAIKPVLGKIAFTISKGGWIASSPYYCVTNDSGIVYIHGGAYLLTILSSIPSKMEALYELVGALNGLHDKMLFAPLNT